MAARKSSPTAEAPLPSASAEGPAPQQAPEPYPDPAPAPPDEVEVGDLIAATLAPPEPVKRFKAPRPFPLRAGGYVLTERGWEIDTGQCDTDQEA